MGEKKIEFDALLEALKTPGRPEDCPLCPDPTFCVRCKYLSKCGDIGPIEDGTVYKMLQSEEDTRAEADAIWRRAMKENAAEEEKKK